MSSAVQSFDQWAQEGRGDRFADGHWPRVSQFIDEMNVTQGMTTIDVGCGNGYAVRAMAERVKPDGHVYGMDFSAQMIAVATAQSQKETDDGLVTYRVSRAEFLPLVDSAVDRLLSVEMLYYAEDTLAVIAEWFRVLKPTGQVWVMLDYYEDNPYSHSWQDLLPMPVQLYSEKDYVRLFKQAGFQSVETRRVLDPRPVDAKNFTPGWGYDSAEDQINFRTKVGSLLIVAA